MPTQTLIPFTITIDSREKRYWEFTNIFGDKNEGELIVPTKISALKTGDYTVDGYESLFVIERKSADDLYNSILSSRHRFTREMSRLNELPLSYIIVEGSLGGILSHEDVLYRSGRVSDIGMKHRQKRVSRSILSWQFRYPNVRWWFLPTRRMAEVWAFRLMEKLVKNCNKPEG